MPTALFLTTLLSLGNPELPSTAPLCPPSQAAENLESCPAGHCLRDGLIEVKVAIPLKGVRPLL